MFPAVCSLLLFVATSLCTQENFKFFHESYPDIYNGFKSTCKTCFGDQCLDNAPGCDYYAETSGILADDDDDDDEGDELRVLGDEALGEVMELAASYENLMECVPLISKKTDCTKENICTGCTACHCVAGGVWNCSQVQQCRSKGWRVDHVVLDNVISILEKSDVCLKTNAPNEKRRRLTQINFDEHNVYKRDTETETTNETKLIETKVNTSESIEEFKEHVLQPINNIIDEKRNELNEIVKIKDNLINLIKTCKNKDIDFNITKPTNHSKVYFTIYKLQFEPHHDILRSNNETLLNKYLNKLKADIHTVLRDVLGIHKLSKTKLPKELIKLIRALNYYLVKNVKNGFQKKEDHGKNADIKTYFRRYNRLGCYIQENILKILEALINTTKPGIGLFSPKTKNIVKRIINQIHSDDSKNHDPNVNNADIMPAIAQSIELYTDKIDSSKTRRKLYAMKNLHLHLSRSINAMTEMLERVNFALYRRMVNVDQTDNFESLLNMDETLKNIQTKLKSYENNPKLKKNFLSRIINFFKKSKIGITKLFSWNNLKTSNKLNLTENNEESIKDMLEELVRRRANQSPRYKRSMGYSRSRFQNKMKSILPKYLRRKMNPAIEESVVKRISKYNEARKEKNLKEAMEQQSREEKRKLKMKEKAMLVVTDRTKTHPKLPDDGLHTRLVFVKDH